MHQPDFVGRNAGQEPALRQLGGRAAGQVIGAEGVLEPVVGCAGIDQERVAELAEVAQALQGRGIDQRERFRLDPDIAPQRVADDFEVGRYGPAFRTASSTCAANCLKFSRNIPASFAAAASYCLPSAQVAR